MQSGIFWGYIGMIDEDPGGEFGAKMTRRRHICPGHRSRVSRHDLARVGRGLDVGFLDTGAPGLEELLLLPAGEIGMNLNLYGMASGLWSSIFETTTP